MLKITKILGVMATVLSLGTGSLAMAAIMDADLGVGVNANTGVNANYGSSASVTGQTNMSATGTAKSSVAGSNATSSAGASNNNAVELNFSAGKSGITITRSDVDDSTNAGVTVTMSGAVNDEASLNSYLKSEVKGNAEVSSVSVTSDEVEVKYDKSVKFLGFIPMTATVTVNVDEQGNVEVSYPWYRFLVSAGSKADLEADIKAQVDASADVSGSAYSKAKMVEAIVMALNASTNASASADVDSSANVNY